MPREGMEISLTAKQAQALRELAALEELPAEVYAAEVLTKHIYHAYTPAIRDRAERLRDRDDHGE